MKINKKHLKEDAKSFKDIGKETKLIQKDLKDLKSRDKKAGKK